MHGNFETIGERPALRFERRITHPIEHVWNAITRPEELAQWFPCEVEELELRVGARIVFRLPQQSLADAPATLPGEVTELDPPTRFSFLWGRDHLHFALEPIDEGAGCLLRFTVELEMREKAARDAAGWHVCLDALIRRLDGESVRRPHESADWRGLYGDYQRRGLPTGAPVPGEG